MNKIIRRILAFTLGISMAFAFGMTTLLSGAFYLKKNFRDRRRKNSTRLGLVAFKQRAQDEIQARLNGRVKRFALLSNNNENVDRNSGDGIDGQREMI